MADNGTVIAESYADCLKITARPKAPLQVVLTGHYDTVFPADSAFQRVITRDDGALNNPRRRRHEGQDQRHAGRARGLRDPPHKARVGWTVLLSPDEEIGSPASAPLLAELGARGHVGLTYEPALSDGTLAGERKGSGNFHLIVTGKAAHARPRLPQAPMRWRAPP